MHQAPDSVVNPTREASIINNDRVTPSVRSFIFGARHRKEDGVAWLRFGDWIILKDVHCAQGRIVYLLLSLSSILLFLIRINSETENPNNFPLKACFLSAFSYALILIPHKMLITN